METTNNFIDVLGGKLTEEQKEIYLFFEKAKDNPKIVELSKTINRPEEHYGRLMAACRKRAGLTQEKLGQLLYCEQSFISKLEQSYTIASTDFIMKWIVVTNSYDFATAIFYDEIGVAAMLYRLKPD